MQDSELEPKTKVKSEAAADAKSSDARVYEIGFIFVPTIAEDQIAGTYGNLKETLSSFGADFISEEMPKMMPLAYTMRKVISNVHNKFNTGYFGWTKFTMDADKVVELKKKLDLDSTIVRFLILKTVRENTISGKKFGRSDMTYRKAPVAKKEGEAEVSAPMDEKAIDQEIDALVAA